MKKIFIAAAFFSLLMLASGAAFAQQEKTAANYVGTWELDVAKSKLPERMRIESLTMNVSQDDKQLKVETTAKRAPRPEAEAQLDANGGMRPDGNRGMRQGGGGRGVMGGNGTITYNLDGSETTTEAETRDGMSPASVTLKAKTEKDGKLKLSSSRSFDTPNGSMSVKTTDTWELQDGGKALKVTRETETPRGSQSSEMYFTRKFVTSVRTATAPIAPAQTTIVSNGETAASATDESLKVVKSGVLNGKALKLVQPEYPPAARAVRATGPVQVQVTFDERGNVISASAVSGHPLLRMAAEKAARESKFAPVIIEGVPVKVTGVIIYNFVF